MKPLVDNAEIIIEEKPDFVSWDDVHDCLWKAHEKNREKGMFMRYPSMPGEEIKQKVGENGHFYVALHNGKVVGTAALLVKEATLWCGKPKEKYAYFCFASVLPEYKGYGIYGKLCEYRERAAKQKGLSKILYDTHLENTHQLAIALKNDYHKVDVRKYADHCNVLLVKWLETCPISNAEFKIRYLVNYSVKRSKWLIKSILNK